MAGVILLAVVCFVWHRESVDVNIHERQKGLLYTSLLYDIHSCDIAAQGFLCWALNSNLVRRALV